MKKKKLNNSKIFFVSIITTIAVLSGFYIYQISELSHTSYLASQKESDIKEIKKENSGLKLSISKNKNLIDVEEKVKEQGYDKVTKIDYMVIERSTVASRK
jgi:cell division protein FtsL